MSILIWNILGIDSNASVEYLRKLFQQYKPMMVGILEPKKQHTRIFKFTNKLGYS